MKRMLPDCRDCVNRNAGSNWCRKMVLMGNAPDCPYFRRWGEPMKKKPENPAKER